jgi:hypothetical protein
MADLTEAIQAAIESDEPIERERVHVWVRDAKDLKTVALLYRLSCEAWSRIEPNLERDESCRLICRYFLLCIAENPSEGIGLNRYEAAGDLEGWVDHLSRLDGTQENLEEVAAAVTKLYLESGEEVRIAIETGFLEHVLEQARLRPLFAHWADDEQLKIAWEPALAWGEAHPNYMKGIREELRARSLKRGENPPED